MFSLILPAHNEAGRLEHCVREVKRVLDGTSYEIIVAEDGSKDNTFAVAKKLACEHPEISKVLHSGRKLGKGLAMKRAFGAARGDILGFIDVDLAVEAEYLRVLLEYMKKYDIAIGSRYIKGADTKRPLSRVIFSLPYNILLRIFFGCRIYDVQCGLKAFSRQVYENIIKHIDEKSWAWDPVVLVYALRKGYRIKEFPVRWVEKKERKHAGGLKRNISDIWLHGKMILKLLLGLYEK